MRENGDGGRNIGRAESGHSSLPNHNERQKKIRDENYDKP
jgi:hypothetical protein